MHFDYDLESNDSKKLPWSRPALSPTDEESVSGRSGLGGNTWIKIDEDHETFLRNEIIITPNFATEETSRWDEEVASSNIIKLNFYRANVALGQEGSKLKYYQTQFLTGKRPVGTRMSQAQNIIKLNFLPSKRSVGTRR